MSIQFNGGRMTLLEIHASPSIFSDFSNSKDSESGVEEFSVSSAFSDEDEHHYQVEFRMKIVSSDGALINLKYLANFSREEGIDDEFKKSPFLFVNSPAIAYPYLRASVSSVLINSGLENIILPTINFQAMYNEEIKPNLE
ncbi:protein-export chaperone SecB [Pseudoalteromonas rhizosphaerae]|uniref:protein-export chaperone SecB n=1 Tax=Pseudoalteromonas rhizosphaerae TaxID=2518973 RepID=UPI00237F46BE|nr:protein-export chaperone SecB [Pseudoalteromonas rhizosphaerae]